MMWFMEELARGAFTYASPTVGQLARAIEVDRRFADLGLGLVTGQSWRSPSRPASVASRRAMCVTSPRFDSGMVRRLTWSCIRLIPTGLEATDRAERDAFPLHRPTVRPQRSLSCRRGLAQVPDHGTESRLVCGLRSIVGVGRGVE